MGVDEPTDDGKREIPTLHVSDRAYPLQECILTVGGRQWSVLHTGLILTHDDEMRLFLHTEDRPPFGVALWPSAIALSYDLATRAEALQGARVLELGGGTGLPGMVAASLGAYVVQTDRHELALGLAARNCLRNGVTGVEQRLADWSEWHETAGYDLILGSDILYSSRMHEHLLGILRRNLAPGGRALVSDPFRPDSLKALGELEASGWSVTASRWKLGDDAAPRAVGVFELAPPSG